jgi:heat shock protein HslJ
MSDRRYTCATFAAVCLGLLAACLGLVPNLAAAQGRPFPFESELRFDADPVRGSKRVPGLLVSSGGEVEIDLWCVSGTGRATIADNTITIVPTAMRDNQCPPERLVMDKDLLEKLTQVTGWRWEGQLLVLVGPQPLRYRPASN